MAARLRLPGGRGPSGAGGAAASPGGPAGLGSPGGSDGIGVSVMRGYARATYRLRWVIVLVWAAIAGVVIGLVIFFVQKRRHPGLEPSPYYPGREWTGGGNVQSQNTDEFVDVSAPPTSESTVDTATSTVASQ